jgi:predicted MFS family arabinose efflux permease
MYAVVFPLGALAPSFPWYLLCRLLSGATMSATNAAAYTLATELCGPSQRTKLTIEMWNIGWACMCTFVAASFATYSSLHWRWQVRRLSTPASLTA